MLLTSAQIKPKSFESRRNLSSFLFYPGRTRLKFTRVLGCCVASTVLILEYPNLSEGAESIGGQRRGDKDRMPLQWLNQCWQSLEEGAGKRCSECGKGPNSKHWFTTSFLQPLPYLVTPQRPEDCQLTSSFLLVLKQ